MKLKNVSVYTGIGKAPRRSFGVMAKVVGSKCNLDCQYCYYLEKENLYEPATSSIMSDEVLEDFIRQYIEASDAPQVTFEWQGGEPTLLGVDYFERVLAMQRKHAKGKRISNSLQTNGTLLDDRWAAFLAKNRFLVGLSLDGPQDLHDSYRVDKRGRPTFELVMRGWGLLQKHKVETNILAVVNRKNAEEPLRVYRFFKEIGAEFIQLIPVVERKATQGLLSLAGPPSARRLESHQQVTDWSVLPEQYGNFLVTIFNEWVREDVGRVFVQLFEICANVWAKQPAPLCWFRESCGTALVIEHNGDLYSCDHYVYPEFKLGNIRENGLESLARSKRQGEFGKEKLDSLPQYCLTCEVRFACNGECPKRRFMLTPDGQPGLNYLCPAYKQFFNHVDPFMKRIVELIKSGQPAERICQEAPNSVLAAIE